GRRFLEAAPRDLRQAFSAHHVAAVGLGLLACQLEPLLVRERLHDLLAHDLEPLRTPAELLIPLDDVEAKTALPAPPHPPPPPPGSRANAAASNAGTTLPREKSPRSPPLLAEPASSENCWASFAKSPPFCTLARTSSAFLRASALCCSFASAGSLIKMWRARISSGAVNRSSRCASV